MVPPVEEWKKMTAEYKQASIPLGRFDFANPAAHNAVDSMPRLNSTITGSDTTPRPNNDSASMLYDSVAGTSATSLGSNVRKSPSVPNAKAFSPASSAGSYIAHQPSIAQQYQQQYQQQQSQPSRNDGDSLEQIYANPSSSSLQNSSGDPLTDDYYNSNVEYEVNEEEGRRPMEAAEYYDKYGLVTSATVESFHSEEENFWFHLRVTFAQSGYSLILYRLYDDFLEFQYALMDEHPVEAGKALPEGAPPGSQPTRIIPKMPGPVDHVDEVVCAQRVDDLTLYLRGLCNLPEYLRGHALFYEFLEPRPGDVTAVVPDEGVRMRWEAAKAADRERDQAVASSATGSRQRGLDEEVVEYLDKMQNVTNGMSRSSINDIGYTGVNGLNSHANLLPLNTDYSNGGGHFTPGYSMTSNNLQHQRNPSNTVRPPSNHSATGGPLGYIGSPTSADGGGPRRSDSSQPMSAGSGISFISPFASSSSSSLPSQSQPPAVVPPPFVKIKIFHRNTDDLIAIRVPPSIKLDALLDKVRERLGGEVSHVRYRDEGSGPMSPGQVQSFLSLPGGARLVELSNDNELDEWIKSAQRLVAYVD